MALYHKWDVTNDFAYVLQFLSLISDSLGSVLLLKEYYNVGPNFCSRQFILQKWAENLIRDL